METGNQKCYDLLVIGGGATGLGVAVDGASRGLKTLLLEKYDFGKGTSSRSTKLIHGGLRYLQQGNISLVFEALHERGLLCKNAPHLVHPLPFVIPNYHFWERPFYGMGLKIYDTLAGKLNFEPSKHLTSTQTLNRIPTLKKEHLKSGTLFYDGQFDDARLAITLARTLHDLGGDLFNYTPVKALIKKNQKVIGVYTNRGEFYAKKVVNATGIFTDDIRRLDDEMAPLIMKPSRGVHLVLPSHFLPSESACIIPHTEDHRLIFMVPWYEHTLIGTTDVEVTAPTIEPKASDAEIDFILKQIEPYLENPPKRSDILSVFAGLRPLVQEEGEGSTSTSRSHKIFESDSDLITITGGKWTTYRKMAEDTVTLAFPDTRCETDTLHLHGYTTDADPRGHLSVYGSEAVAIDTTEKLHLHLPYYAGEIIWAVRYEMAKTVEDVLARRTRALFLNAKAAIEIAPKVAEIMAKELKKDKKWLEDEVHAFKSLAQNYIPK